MIGPETPRKRTSRLIRELPPCTLKDALVRFRLIGWTGGAWRDRCTGRQNLEKTIKAKIKTGIYPLVLEYFQKALSPDKAERKRAVEIREGAANG